MRSDWVIAPMPWSCDTRRLAISVILMESISLSLAADRSHDHEHEYGHLLSAARKISARIDQFDELPDMNDLLEIATRLAAVESPESVGQAEFLAAMSLASKADRAGPRTADLDQAINVMSRVLERSAHKDPLKLGAYAALLKMRFDRLGDLRDIDEFDPRVSRISEVRQRQAYRSAELLHPGGLAFGEIRKDRADR